MPVLNTLAVTLGGFLAGFIGTQLVTRALRLLYALLGKSTGEPQKYVPQRRLWTIPLLFLHPGVWVLVGVPFLGYLAYSGRVAAIWGWFVGGFILSVAYVSTLVLFALRKLKRKRASAAGA